MAVQGVFTPISLSNTKAIMSYTLSDTSYTVVDCDLASVLAWYRFTVGLSVSSDGPERLNYRIHRLSGSGFQRQTLTVPEDHPHLLC